MGSIKNIQLITKDNGVGLSADRDILMALLTKAGYNCFFTDVHSAIYKSADINIFLELVNEKHIKTAPINVLIPNAEWFNSPWKRSLPFFDLIICKTIDCLAIFSKLHNHCVYTSFTSIDKYLPITVNNREFVHIAGRSSHKNTQAVYDCWRANPHLKPMHLLKHENTQGYMPAENIKYYFKKMPADEMDLLMNQTVFHLCPSEYEGFGHYLNEARSVGGIIISTDAAPMNELVNDKFGRLVTPYKSYYHNLGLCHKIKPEALKGVVEQVQGYSDYIIGKMRKESRQEFLDNDLFFRNEFLKTIKQL